MVDRVVWREGLFIRPQHFQQSDRYVSHALMTRTKELQSNAWGFFDLQLDMNQLGSGKVTIKSASGVLPDGELFQITGQTHVLGLDIKEGDSAKSVYLVLPIALHQNDEVYFEEEKTFLTRYVAKNISNISNINAGEESQTDLLCARHNFKLLLEDDVNEGYVKIKVATVGSISSSGIVSLEEDYMPTYLHLHAAKDLMAKLNELVSTLEYRSEKLAEKLSDSNVQASELGDYLMLQLVNKTLSRLHFLMTQDRTHPAELYLELVGLMGELAVFMKKEKRLLTQPTYQHDIQGESFDIVIDELKDMLSMVLEQNSIALPIEERKYGIFVAQVQDKSLIKTASFILAVHADMQSDKLIKMLLSNLKVGSIETIRNLVNYHLAGYKMKPLSVAPRQIPYRMDHIYFKLEIGNEDMVKLEASGGFAFHLSAELTGAEYHLWAIRND